MLRDRVVVVGVSGGIAAYKACELVRRLRERGATVLVVMTPAAPVDEQVRAGKVVVLDVDVQGGASVRAARPRAVSVFVYPPSIDSLRARLESRGTDKPEVIEERLRNAPSEMAQAVHYDYIIMNDDLERAQAALIAIHDAELARVRGVLS